jgi:hypothetical protein
MLMQPAITGRGPPGVTVYAVAAPLHALRWPEMVAYEWGSVLNAELLHRSC